MDFRLYFRSRQGEMVHLLKQLVALESPTQDKKAVDACASFVAKELKKVGCKVTTHPQKDTGDLVVAEFAPGKLKDADDEILVLTHVDTVWPVGKIAKMPFYVQGDRLYGPGVLDMKAGIVMLLAALRALQRAQRQAAEEDHRSRQPGRGDRERRVDGAHPQAGPQGLARPLPRTGPSRRGPEARAEGPPRRPPGCPGPFGPRRNAAKRHQRHRGAGHPDRPLQAPADRRDDRQRRPRRGRREGQRRRRERLDRARRPLLEGRGPRARPQDPPRVHSRTCTAPGSRSPSRARPPPWRRPRPRISSSSGPRRSPAGSV